MQIALSFYPNYGLFIAEGFRELLNVLRINALGIGAVMSRVIRV